NTFFFWSFGWTFLIFFFDTVFFVSIVFIGSMPGSAFFEIFITTVFLKLVLTIFNVPFGYIAMSLYRKGKIEQLDNWY
ncbi:queuosine precursor transporter, partial [Staphylococcus epidermidis]